MEEPTGGLRGERRTVTRLINEYGAGLHGRPALPCGCIKLPSGKGYKLGAHGGEVTDGEHAH
jgi:hypothetical protein